MESISGDGLLFEGKGKWYVQFPYITSISAPAGSASPTYMGVDTGIVNMAVISTPNQSIFVKGKHIRAKRKRFAELRRRYQKKKRLDLVKKTKGKESRWMRQINHITANQIIATALLFDDPIIRFEELKGIRKNRKSKEFNRELNSWTFRQLMDFVKYKAEREGISVEFIDPKNTSKECSKCHHISDANRRTQNHFECESCHYTAHADHVGATNIRLRGLYVQEDGLSDIARSPIGFQTGNIDSLPDAVLNSNL